MTCGAQIGKLTVTLSGTVTIAVTVGKASIWSSGAPKLRLLRFLQDSNKKSIHLELWSSQAQTAPFPKGF